MTEGIMGRCFVCIGSINVDLIFPVRRLPEAHEKLRCDAAHVACGGAAANTAFWLARLGNRSALVACAGDDPLGDRCVKELAEAGVDVRHVQRTATLATGIAAVLAQGPAKRMVVAGGANTALDPARVPPALFGPGTHLHDTTPLGAIGLPLLRLAKARGATTSCDIDEVPGADLVPHLDLCFLRQGTLERRLPGLSVEEARAALAGSQPLTLVVTQGERGASAADASRTCFVPAEPVEAVDLTGGGDAFAAGFLDRWARGEPLPACLAAGLRLARAVIARPGARG
jgi:ribokinase